MGISTDEKLSMALDEIPDKDTYRRDRKVRNSIRKPRHYENNRRFSSDYVIKHIVRISNLDHSIRDVDLMELFSSVGPVVKTWVDYDRTDRSKGTGGCIYEKEVDAKEAIIKFNGRKIQGSNITLEYQQSKSYIRRGRRNGSGGRYDNRIRCPW